MTDAEHKQFMKKTYGQFRSHLERRAEHAEWHGLPVEQFEMAWGLDWLRLKADAALGTPCNYCGAPLTVATYALDHDWPVARWREYAQPMKIFAWENVRLICASCNKAKGAMTIREYFSLLTFLRTLPTPVRHDIRLRLIVGASFRFGKGREK